MLQGIQISGQLYHDIPPDFQCFANSTDDDPPSDIVQVLWNFVSPFIFFVGLIGNALILGVMTRKWMKGTSTGAYLIAMAIADILVLLTGMIVEWLEANGFLVFKELYPATCKLEKFLFYTSGDTAIWIRVLFTLDRFVAVCFPMSNTECCLPWKAKYYSLGALLGATLKNLHVLGTRGAEYIVLDETLFSTCPNVVQFLDTNSTASMDFENLTITILMSNCGSTTPFNKYFDSYVRPWIAFSLVSVLPFCIILVCNLWIIRALIQLKRTRAKQLRVSSQDKNLFQMTAMSLSASFCFLVCVTPSIILLIGKPYWNQRGSDNQAYEIAKAINNQLYYVVHSANFFLYCITGKRFRDSLVAMCRGQKRYSSLSASIRSSAFSSSLLSRNSTPMSLISKNNHKKVSSDGEQKGIEEKA